MHELHFDYEIKTDYMHVIDHAYCQLHFACAEIILYINLWYKGIANNQKNNI